MIVETSSGLEVALPVEQQPLSARYFPYLAGLNSSVEKPVLTLEENVGGEV